MINKIIKHPKFIDRFSYIFCIIYFIFVLLYGIAYTNKINSEQKAFNDMMTQVNILNNKVEQNKYFNSKNEVEEEIPAEPLFNDGYTALIEAYAKLMTAKSCYIEADGQMTTVTAGMNVVVKTDMTIIKYNDGKFYEYMANALKQTDVPDFLISFVKSKSNEGAKRMHENGVTQRYGTKDVKYVNNEVVADFSSAYYKPSVNDRLALEHLFIIDKTTVKEVTYFKVNYKNNVPTNYYVKAKLDPKLSAEKYGLILKDRAGSTAIPQFSSVTVSVVIDAYGYVTALTVADECTITMNVPVLGSTSCPCSTVTTYVMTGINEEMTFKDEMF